VSNIYINSCLKEGFNLQILEFVCVKKLQNKFPKSAAIVSEFTGCAESMKGSVIINPYDIEDISHKLEEAISMNSF
jgi:trehalose 6-phosphate synthase